MREIKFRAFDDGRMLTMPLDKNFGISRFFGILRDDAIVMQYTGLKDKNGKEIYEGDIMHDTSINARCAVVFGCFETLLDDYGIGETSPKFCVEWSDKSGHGEIDVRNEVIGNIYENPELLCSIK